MKLRIGMIVGYKPTGTELGFMKERRSICNINENLPAVVVAIDDDVHGDPIINLKVLLDGQGDIWAVDVKQGEEVGQWDFYPTEEAEFIDEINELVEKLAAQKSELIELSDRVQKDIENYKITLAAIQEAKAEPITAVVSEPEIFDSVTLKVTESATEKEANAKKV